MTEASSTETESGSMLTPNERTLPPLSRTRLIWSKSFMPTCRKGSSEQPLDKVGTGHLHAGPLQPPPGVALGSLRVPDEHEEERHRDEQEAAHAASINWYALHAIAFFQHLLSPWAQSMRRARALLDLGAEALVAHVLGKRRAPPARLHLLLAELRRLVDAAGRPAAEAEARAALGAHDAAVHRPLPRRLHHQAGGLRAVDWFLERQRFHKLGHLRSRGWKHYPLDLSFTMAVIGEATRRNVGRRGRTRILAELTDQLANHHVEVEHGRLGVATKHEALARGDSEQVVDANQRAAVNVELDHVAWSAGFFQSIFEI